MDTKPLKGRKILIVEDDPASRLYLNKILEKTEALILNAEDGSQAIDVAKTHPEIELILMDIQLPVMDGYATAAKIKTFMPNVAIIAQTAYGLMDEKQKIIDAGFDDYMVKPIIASPLIEKMVNLLKKTGRL
jgi:CheY-like chemotaxis protein